MLVILVALVIEIVIYHKWIMNFQRIILILPLTAKAARYYYYYYFGR